MEQGKDTILMFQSTDAALAAAGYVLGHLTDNSYSIENDILDETTKFGRVVGYGQNSEAFEFTAFGDRKDPGQMAVLNAIKNKKQIKVWQVDIVPNASGTHDAVFAYGVIENVEIAYSKDGFTEFSSTLQVLGASQDGEIPALPPEIIAFAQYGFEAPGASTGEFPEQTSAPVIP
jgi:TP901-1 family phage major tail protein